MKKDLFLWLGGGWLTLMGLGHSWGHYELLVAGEDLPLARAALFEAMRAYEVGGPFSPSQYDYLVLFSLSLSFLLLGGGLATLLTAWRAGPDFKRDCAGFSAIFWLVTGALFMIAAPAIQPLVINAGAALLFAAHWYRSRPTP